MKIYKGPSTKDFGDDQHELVDRKDLSDTTPWTESKLITANMTKDHIERQSIAHILIDENDVLALHQGLVKGLMREAKSADELRRKVNSLTDALTEVRKVARLRNMNGTDEALAKVVEIVDAAVNEKPRPRMIVRLRRSAES